MVALRESQRLTSQAGRILALLTSGPASNRMLAMISLKYTSRVSDLRRAGHNIVVTHRDYDTGDTTYELVPPAAGAAGQEK